MSPLAGVRVVDFSLLLPGPLATLLLARAGADVTRVEPPGGDPMRKVGPFLDGASIPHAWLAAGKHSVVADLADGADRARVLDLVRSAHVLVEGFRPGALRRFGLSYDDLAPGHPGLVYCSITGYGQGGPDAARAGHDLTYMAQARLLDVVAGPGGNPPLPPTLVADIGAGALPAAMNILLALRRRELTGAGVHLDVSMTANLDIFNLFALADATAGAPAKAAGERFFAGGTPRYGIYRCADGRHLAVAALEDRFWRRFLAAIGVEECGGDGPTRTAVAAAVASRPAAEWEALFGAEDVCAAVVRRAGEAVVPRRGLPLPLHGAWDPANQEGEHPPA